MAILYSILLDQLSHSHAFFKQIDKKNDYIFMHEDEDNFTLVKHHKKKLVFQISAMRHFSEELKKKNYNVIYRKLTINSKNINFFDNIKEIVKKNKIEKIVFIMPSEFHVYNKINKLKSMLKIPVDIVDNNNFLATLDDFNSLSSGKKVVMENFYRFMRKKFNILMKNDKPEGGQWNFDHDNRSPPSSSMPVISPSKFSPDTITKTVISLVQARYSDHFGEIEPFFLAVKRSQAKVQLKSFVDERLVHFGKYQDAMLEKNPDMYHAQISFYLNNGLLSPMECIEHAVSSYKNHKCQIASVEGFVRQILGWREFVRCVYWKNMPSYSRLNYLNARRALPKFYWTGNVGMNCLKQCIDQTNRFSYAHHIQRLMVLGNFLLLCGVSPKQANEWYWIVYADAYEWVELPNVSGMILFADGGKTIATKPYCASGSYINKQSDYCKNCRYNVKLKTGRDACPFNYLYWNFLIKNQKTLSSNPRLNMAYGQLRKMDAKKIKSIVNSANEFLEGDMGGSDEA